ncbi:hypothetical protein VaNZ11_013317, partial [Volvox africanus]
MLELSPSSIVGRRFARLVRPLRNAGLRLQPTRLLARQRLCKATSRTSCKSRLDNSNNGPYAAVSCTANPHSVIAHDLRLQLGPPGAKRPVLNGVHFQVKRGSLHMLLGPNGCGKSTLLKVLGGLLVPDGGQVDTDQPSGFVFQNPDHQVVMPTVAADVAFGLGRYNLTETEVSSFVRSALRLVNLENFMYRATQTLSGGQRQRVAIAGALAENPKLLLLDELTTFLDREDQFGVLHAVRSITSAHNDVTAIWVTHRFEELRFADAASYMENG